MVGSGNSVPMDSGSLVCSERGSEHAGCIQADGLSTTR